MLNIASHMSDMLKVDRSADLHLGGLVLALALLRTLPTSIALHEAARTQGAPYAVQLSDRVHEDLHVGGVLRGEELGLFHLLHLGHLALRVGLSQAGVQLLKVLIPPLYCMSVTASVEDLH